MYMTVTSKGQVTLPAEARKKLGIKAGTKLQVLVRDGALEVIPVVGSIRDLKRTLSRPDRPVTLEEMDNAIAEGAAASCK